MSVGEYPQPEQPSTSTNDDHVKRVHALNRENRRLNVWKFADEVGISIASFHQIFTEKHKLRCVSKNYCRACWLTIRKRTVLKWGRKCLPMQIVIKYFYNIIIGYDTWVYGCDVETKLQSLQWMGKRSLRPKKHGWVGQRSMWCWLRFLIWKELFIVNL